MPRPRNTKVEEAVEDVVVEETTEEVTPEEKTSSKDAVEDVVVEETTEEVTPEEKTSSKDAVTVVWRLGSREYSRADHGPDFQALAAEFAKKKEGKVV